MPDNDADALNAAITTGMIMNFIVLREGDCLRVAFITGFLGVAIISPLNGRRSQLFHLRYIHVKQCDSFRARDDKTKDIKI